mgnify:CR=1 FL=1
MRTPFIDDVADFEEVTIYAYQLQVTDFVALFGCYESILSLRGTATKSNELAVCITTRCGSCLIPYNKEVEILRYNG